MKRIIDAQKVLLAAEKKKEYARNVLIEKANMDLDSDFAEERRKLLLATLECERARQEAIKAKNEVLAECGVERVTKTGVKKWKDKDGNEHEIEYVVV